MLDQINATEIEQIYGVELVLDSDFPDPSLYRSPYDKDYYAVGTATWRTEGDKRVSLAKSSDLKNWELSTIDPLINFPEWAKNGDLWAPFVYVDQETGAFRMYYAVRQKTGGFGISAAESFYPDKLFADYSKEPIVGHRTGIFTEEEPENEFIDPFAYSEGGKNYLVFGSHGRPIQRVELDKTGLRLAHGAKIEPLLYPISGTIYNRVEEGPWIHTHNGKKFLFTSGGDAFGNGVRRFGEYATSVAVWNEGTQRFEKPINRNDPLEHIILEGSEIWKNPGNVCIITDNEGKDWLFTHAIDRNNQYFSGTTLNRRVMIRAQIFYNEQEIPYIPGGRFNGSGFENYNFK